MSQQFVPALNNPHRVVLSNSPDRAPASPGALAAVMAAIETDDEEAIERLASLHARPEGPRTLSLSRGGPLFPSNPGYDRRPDVMAARLAQLGGARSMRPTAVVKLDKNATEVALPGANAGLQEALAWLAEANPDFSKMGREEQLQRGRALVKAIASIAEITSVAASRGASTKVLVLTAYAGRNDIERAVSMARAADPAFEKQGWDQQVRAACELLKFFNGRVIS